MLRAVARAARPVPFRLARGLFGLLVLVLRLLVWPLLGVELREPRLPAPPLEDGPALGVAPLLLLVGLDGLPLQPPPSVRGVLAGARKVHRLGLWVLVARPPRRVALPPGRVTVPLVGVPLRLPLRVRAAVH